MQFREGDRVLHPIHGVGQIERIEKKEIVGDNSRLYYQIHTDNGTLWVPVDSQLAVGLRLLTSKDELGRFRSILKSRPVALTDHHGQRHIEIEDRLNSGSLELICQAVRDLTAYSWKKSLNTADAAALKRARGRLYKEWAAAEGVSTEQAIEEIEALLAHAEKTHK